MEAAGNGTRGDFVFRSSDVSATQGENGMDKDRPEFHLRVTEDSLAVLLDCTVSSEEFEALLARIKTEMSGLGVVDPPSHEQLDDRLRRAAESGTPLANEVLVQGQPPVPPKDGIITWAQDFFSTHFAMDKETGAIDYRERDDHRIVEQGQLLAHLTHPEEGIYGRDVFGRPIPAKSARKNLIRVGSNVRVENKQDALYYYADKNGRIRWAAETLAVDDVYTIHGNVCMETGHIDHPGALVVKGDVMSGFKVRAEGNIEIGGVVEPADIQAGGDLTVRSGITGSEGHTIKVAGSIHARYILDANVEAGEDINVKSEIIHSTVKTRGAIVMPEGRLIGGEVSALRGVVVGQAGSDAQVPTLIVTAEDHSLAERQHSKQKEIESLEENLKKIHEKVDPLMSREKTLTPKQREIASELLGNASKMEQFAISLRSEMEEMKVESLERAKPHISIRNKLYSETTLRMRKTVLLVNETHHGPLHARLEQGEIVLRGI